MKSDNENKNPHFGLSLLILNTHMISVKSKKNYFVIKMNRNICIVCSGFFFRNKFFIRVLVLYKL